MMASNVGLLLAVYPKFADVCSFLMLTGNAQSLSKKICTLADGMKL